MLGANYKKMNIKNFENINTLESTLVKKISLCVSDAIKKYGDARILLSGGSTPINLYSLLSKENVDWGKVKIGLVDERFVDQKSEYSNESHIKNNLVKNWAKTAILSSMVCCIDNESLNLEMLVTVIHALWKEQISLYLAWVMMVIQLLFFLMIKNQMS